jgi:hypothetical protein
MPLDSFIIQNLFITKSERLLNLFILFHERVLFGTNIVLDNLGIGMDDRVLVARSRA